MGTAPLDQLLTYTRPGALEDISGLAEAVTAMCTADDQALSPTEAALAYDILCRVYPDAEMDVRRRLAERLAARPDTPRPLCLMIANDTIDIARHAILAAPHLDDDDLISVAVEKGSPHKLAVAQRANLSARVTDVLVYLADADVALALVGNDTAQFSDQGLKRLVNASRTQVSLQDPLLRRTDMPVEMARLMYDWVGQALKMFIRDSFGVKVEQSVGEDVDAAVRDAAEGAAAPSPTASPARPDDDAYPGAFDDFLVALRGGDLASADREVQTLGQLPATAAQRLLYNGDGKALAVLCKALGAGRSLYAETFTRLYGTPPYSSFSRSREFTRAMTFFDQLPRREADTILAHWRLRPETLWGDPARFNPAWEMRQRKSKKN